MAGQYFDDFKGNIYKKMDSHYLKVSPSKNGEDRRYNNIIFKSQIKKHIAFERIHLLYSNIHEKWMFQGEHFEANKCLKDYDDYLTFIRENLPYHNHDFLYSENRYHLFSYNGHLVYTEISQYAPRCLMRDLQGEFSGWTTIKWLKPVYNISQKKWM